MTTLPKRILTYTPNLFLNNICQGVRSMHQSFKRNLALTLFSALFFACEDPIGIIVDTPGTGGQITTLYTDTIKVASSTVMLDSTFTSGQASGVVGRYRDPIFGQVTANTFSQITLPLLSTGAYAMLSFPKVDSGSTIYDSVYVYVAHNGFSQGDSTKPYSLALHRLTEDFGKDKKYTKDDVLKYTPTPLATKTFSYKELKRSISDKQDSLLKFKLPNAVGQEIYNLFGTETGRNIDKFTAAIKGLAFISSATGENVYGISVSGSYIQIFYHTTGSTDRKSIPLSFFGQRFSQIQSVRQGTILQNLQLSKSIPASMTNNRTYLQTGTGISPKLTFQSLAALQKNTNIIINKAELVFEPDLDQVNSNYRTPPQVALVQLNDNNQVLKTAGNLIKFVALETLGSTQYVASYNASTNSYTFNFTAYLQDLINKKETSQGLALVPSFLNTTNGTIAVYNSDLSRMVVKNIKLNVFYSTKK